MSQRKLYVHYDSKLVGILTEDEHDLLHFSYDSNWTLDKESFPLSLALPLCAEGYSGKIVTSFFENLIAEGDQRRQIEQFAGLPAGDDAAYLERFGEDCAGALSISVQPFQSAQTKAAHEIEVPFHTIEDAIEKGLPIGMVLEKDGELPPFSLAGAQAKFPCCVHEGRIYLPGVGEPTTHIVKLPIRSGENLLDSVENEYLSMRLAKHCGLNVSDVMILGDHINLFCIERFDRLTGSNRVRRVHTHDFCQALGRPNKEKYERHGGPSFATCYKLVRDHSSDVARDLFALLDWIGFNLALGNNVSHAKNLSLIQSPNGVKLAPFYDLICTAIYRQYNAQFAFRIAEVSSWDKITIARVDVFAKQLGLRGNFVISRWIPLFERLNKGVEQLSAECFEDKARMKTLNKIGQEIRKRIQSLRKALQKS